MKKLTIIRESKLSGDTHAMTLNLTPGEMIAGLVQLTEGVPVAQAFPTLSSVECDFVLYGATPEEWDAFYANVPYPGHGVN